MAPLAPTVGRVGLVHVPQIRISASPRRSQRRHCGRNGPPTHQVPPLARGSSRSSPLHIPHHSLIPAALLLLYWFAIQFFSGFGSIGNSQISQVKHRLVRACRGFVAGMLLVNLLRPKQRYRSTMIDNKIESDDRRGRTGNPKIRFSNFPIAFRIFAGRIPRE